MIPRTVRSDIEISGNEFFLGRLLTELPASYATIKPTVLDERRYSLIRFHSKNIDRLDANLEAKNHIRRFSRIRQSGDNVTYWLQMDPPKDPAIRCFENNHCILLQAKGDSEMWRFHVLMTDEGNLQDLWSALREADVQFNLRGVKRECSSEQCGSVLTARQREVMKLAYERGYFKVPKDISVNDLAAEMGISDQAVSARIRRAVHSLCEEMF